MAVYLKLPEIATDARPTVTLSGEIADLAGNLRTSGTATSLDDGINPKLDHNAVRASGEQPR